MKQCAATLVQNGVSLGRCPMTTHGPSTFYGSLGWVQEEKGLVCPHHRSSNPIPWPSSGPLSNVAQAAELDEAPASTQTPGGPVSSDETPGEPVSEVLDPVAEEVPPAVANGSPVGEQEE